MLASDGDTTARERLALLLSRSPVRRRLVALLVEGKTRKVIATEMRRSQHTIDAHLKAMYRVVGVGDRARLMMMAQELIGPDDPPPRFRGVALGKSSPYHILNLQVWAYHSIEAAVDASAMCSDCLELSNTVTLGSDSTEGFLEDRGALDYVVRDNVGRYWVGQRGGVKVYSPSGQFLQTVGSRGQGPFEFEFAQPVAVDAEGMVRILDPRLGRETVVRSDFSLFSDVPFPVGFGDAEWLPGHGSRYAMAKWIATPDRLGYPLHIVFGSEIELSIGVTPRADTTVLTPSASERVLTVTNDGLVLSAMLDQYVIEAWETTGRRVVGFEMPGLNQSAVRPGTWSWDNPPPNHVGAIASFGDRFLPVISRHRRHNWKDLVIERVSADGRPYLSAANGQVPSVYRSRLDLLDLDKATVVASTRYDGWLMRFVEPRSVIHLDYTKAGEPLLQLLEVAYRTRFGYDELMGWASKSSSDDGVLSQ